MVEMENGMMVVTTEEWDRCVGEDGRPGGRATLTAIRGRVSFFVLFESLNKIDGDSYRGNTAKSMWSAV